MKHKKDRSQATLLPLSLFAIYFLVMLLMSGMHMGVLVLLETLHASELVKTILPILYWGLAALLLTLFTRYKIKETYDVPMQRLSEGARRVAQGDFSVYIPTIHTADRMDYLDYMIVDFNKMVAELGGLETMKTDFISNVSHEIKAPLALISSHAQLLQGKALTEEERAQYLSEIIKNVRRLADLVTNILKLNKIENQAIQPMAQPYDLCAQLAECALLFESDWERRDIDFQFEIEDRVILCGDKEMLALVWNNLISNAIKFTPEGGTVVLKQTSDADSVTVTVSDTGCGMSQETMGRIFEKFYQGDTSHAMAGNGLGLALVQRILQISEGTVTVSSTLGKGSTFTVRLPVERKEML